MEPTKETVKGTSLERQHLLGAVVLGALIFPLVFFLAYLRIPENNYVNRDDGIITVSHAKNWVEYGSIGINPAGERVEGYSSPLQMVIFAAVYALTRMDYATYFLAMTYLCAAGLGACFILFMRHRPIRALCAAPLAAFLLTRDPSFLEWHGSGMENPLTHLFLMLAGLLLAWQLGDGKVRWWHAPLLVGAAITRIEAIYTVGVLLAVYVGLWFLLYRNKGAIQFAALVGILWAALFVARWQYFGILLPNTAAAQDISVGARIYGLFTGNPMLRGTSTMLAGRIALMHLGFVAAACFPVFLFTEWSRRYLPAAALLTAIVLTALSTPYLFGEARLDPTRLSTQMAPAAVFLAALLLVGIRRWWLQLGVAVVFVAGTAFGLLRLGQDPYYLWFSEGVFETYRGEIVRIREKHDLFRPTLANPDLGLMSWHKDMNIVDLGEIGSPVLAALDTPSAKADYFFDIAAPDILEIHGMWSAMYAPFFRDPRFAERYVPERAIIDWYLRKRFAQSPSFRAEYGDVVREGYWVRKDMLPGCESRERVLTDVLRDGVSLLPIQAELEYCAAVGLAGWDASYVPRSAYRFLPEFRAAGLHTALMVLLDAHAQELGYTTALLDAAGNPHWHRDLLAFLEGYSVQRIDRDMEQLYTRHFAHRESLRDRRVYRIVDGLELKDLALQPIDPTHARLLLLFDAQKPLWKDMKIYIHAEPSTGRAQELPPDNRRHGFINWDIPEPQPPTSGWHEKAHVVLHRTVATHPSLDRIRLGMYTPGGGVQGTEVLIPLPSDYPSDTLQGVTTRVTVAPGR